MDHADLLILQQRAGFKNSVRKLASEGLISVSLPNGETGIVKDEPNSNELLRTDRWCLNSKGYMVTSRRIDGRQKSLLFHRMLLNTPEGFDVDHVNGCRMDNRPENLRIVSKSANKIDSPKVQHKFGVAGVRYDESRSYYIAQWHDNAKKCHQVSFSAKILGHELALALAKQARKDAMSNIQFYIDNKKMPDNFDPDKYALFDEYFHGCTAEPLLFETK